jgi:hypothetical protein
MLNKTNSSHPVVLCSIYHELFISFWSYSSALKVEEAGSCETLPDHIASHPRRPLFSISMDGWCMIEHVGVIWLWIIVLLKKFPPLVCSLFLHDPF